MGFEIGPIKQWTEVERLTAARLVMACLASAPKFGKRRRTILAKLLQGDRIRCQEAFERSPEISAKIDNFVGGLQRELVPYAPPNTQRERLYFDLNSKDQQKKAQNKKAGKKKSGTKFSKPDEVTGTRFVYGQHIKAVLTAGGIALAIVWSRQIGKPLNLTRAKALLQKRPFGELPAAHGKQTIDDHWEEKRDVAHLCAALLLCIEERHADSARLHRRRRFTAIEENFFIRDLPTYLGYAEHIRRELIDLKNSSKHDIKLSPRRLPKDWNLNPLVLPSQLIPPHFVAQL